jgi:hypothetical protein
VNYPLGLKNPEDGAHAEVTDGHVAGFIRINRTVSPSVIGEYPKGTYTITEEFVPAFLPKDWKFVGTPQTDNSLCFTANEVALRDLFSGWPRAPLQVRLYLSNAPIIKETQNGYDLAELVESAQRLGFKQCKQLGRAEQVSKDSTEDAPFN